MEGLDWLTAAYMEDALRAYFGDATLRLSKCDMQMALGKGENFGGHLLRVHTEYKGDGGVARNASFIVKTSFEADERLLEKFRAYDVFNREMSIYENVLPKLMALLKDIGSDENIFAKTVYIDYERPALIFEDLAERGYVMKDRTLGLDMEHVQLILRKLAKMHAASAVLSEREGGSLEQYDRGFFNRHTDAYSSFFLTNLDACTRLVAQWPDFERYHRKLVSLRPHYMEIGKRCFEPTAGHVNVLAHGDVWTNNVMFKYDADNGRLVDAVLIDFQYSFWGSPSLDLHHFFNTSMEEGLRSHRQGELLQHYHSVFADVLRKLHYHSNAIPHLHGFCMQAEQKRFFAMHSSCFIQPIMINTQNNDDADFSALMGLDERSTKFKNSLYQNTVVQRNLRHLLPLFDRRGLLDANQCD